MRCRPNSRALADRSNNIEKQLVIKEWFQSTTGSIESKFEKYLKLDLWRRYLFPMELIFHSKLAATLFKRPG